MKKKHQKTLLKVIVGVLVALALVILWLPQMTVTESTPEWVVNFIDGLVAFREAFNATTIIIIGLILVGSILYVQFNKNKKNKKLLKYVFAVLAVLAGYLLILPGLAAALPEQAWLVSFASGAINFNDFINQNAGFFTFVGVSGVLVFVAYKYIK